jgi:dipeptidyl aminopeptidase/acylaminoacyl peptidase
MAQIQAILAWESYTRIAQITAPTLVIHGKSDALVPPGNGELIAARIPDARLVLLEHASHLFLTDQTEAAKKEILEFLASDFSSNFPRVDPAHVNRDFVERVSSKVVSKSGENPVRK